MEQMNSYIELLKSENISFASIIIATILPTAISYIYYLFYAAGRAAMDKQKFNLKKSWLESAEMTEKEARAMNWLAIMIIHLFLSFIMALFLLVYTNAPGKEGIMDSFSHGFVQGILLSIVLVLPVYISNSMFNRIRVKLIVIYSLYWMVTIGVMGGVVDAMNHW